MHLQSSTCGLLDLSRAGTWLPDNPTAKGSLNKCFQVKKPFLFGLFRAQRVRGLDPHSHTAIYWLSGRIQLRRGKSTKPPCSDRKDGFGSPINKDWWLYIWSKTSCTHFPCNLIYAVHKEVTHAVWIHVKKKKKERNTKLPMFFGGKGVKSANSIQKRDNYLWTAGQRFLLDGVKHGTKTCWRCLTGTA